jgi:Tfp pilus assembly protein PilF
MQKGDLKQAKAANINALKFDPENADAQRLSAALNHQ